MHRDFLEFVEIIARNRVDFLIIGGIALAYYGFPRYTGDLDIWIKPDIENGERLFQSIEKFFDTSIQADLKEFIHERKMITLGEEPVQIQIHTYLDGVTEDELWNTKTAGTFGPVDVFYIGKETFIKNKRAVGRDQDLVDIKKLLQ